MRMIRRIRVALGLLVLPSGTLIRAAENMDEELAMEGLFWDTGKEKRVDDYAVAKRVLRLRRLVTQYME